MRVLFSFLLLICNLSCNESVEKFELCPGKKYPYYYPALEYKGGFYEIKEHFYNNYKAIQLPNNNGVVKIRFSVNCYGKSGNYHIDTYNFAYKSNIIDKQITEQLLGLTKSLSDWIPAEIEGGHGVNTHKFFAFKIVNGNLVDILPK